MKFLESYFANIQDTFTLLSGPFEMPDVIRRHPRYHAIWETPHMKELADVRRANGQSAGLPLPIDGSDME